jgi:hypothetical protein
MQLVHYDESGDDGFPSYSSPLFVLTATCVADTGYQAALDGILAFRAAAESAWGLPRHVELHAKPFLTNKKQYQKYSIPDGERVAILEQYCEAIAGLALSIINVVINKTIIRKRDYPVLGNALTYSIQRIENAVRRMGPNERFSVQCDQGRVGKMRAIARDVQMMNVIPSKIAPGTYRDDIKRLDGDLMECDSRRSHFVQVSDVVSYLVYVYMMLQLGAGALHGRMPAELNENRVQGMLDRLKPCLNLRASQSNLYGYGIVCYPNQ